MLPENIIYFGLLLQATGQITYIWSIIKGQAKPNLVSWVIWMVAPFLGFFFQIKSGAGISALPVFMAGFGPFLVILFSIFIKNGYWKISVFDMYCGALSVLALIFYIVTHNLGISILFAILSDALACIPTIVKTWKFPKTENSWLYFCAMASNILGLLTLTAWSFSVAAFSVSIILQCVVILFCIYQKNIFRNI